MPVTISSVNLKMRRADIHHPWPPQADQGYEEGAAWKGNALCRDFFGESHCHRPRAATSCTTAVKGFFGPLRGFDPCSLTLAVAWWTGV